MGLGLAISSLFVWMVVRGVDAAAAFDELRRANPSFYVPAAVVLMASIWVRAVRWRVLLGPVGSVGTSAAFTALTIGYMANNALPARLGEFVRVYVLNRETRIRAPAILGTIILERVFDVLTLVVLLVLAALASGWRSPWNVPLAGLAGAAVVAFAIMYMMVSGLIKPSSPVISTLRRLAERPFGGAVTRLISSLIEGFRSVASGRALVTILGLSVGSWLIESAVYFLVLRAFGIHEGGYWLAIVVTCISNLSGVIPAGPANIGAFEFFTKEAVVLFGVDGEKGLAFAIAAHFVVIIPPTVLGLLLVWRKGLLALRTDEPRQSV